MSYVRLIPSELEYAQKFRLLDSVDFKIVEGLCKHGFSNLSKLSAYIGIPKQTVSYHSRKLEKRDLVRFRALIDEPKLGLKSFSVFASAPLGKEDISSRAMTCFPLWRYLAVMDGWKRGNYVRYGIPPDKERDLTAFLDDVRKRSLISDFQIVPTMSPNYPLFDLEFYNNRGGIPIFDWERWVKDIDTFQGQELLEPTNYEKSKLDLYDLIILRCLEINARTNQRKIVKEMARILKDKETRLIPLVSRRIRDIIAHRGFIKGYRFYLLPNPVSTTQLLMYHLTFSNASSLRKFTAGLDHLPYNTSYEKILKKDELFVRFVIPSHEIPSVWKTITELAKGGHLKEAHLLVGDLVNKTWDNVEIYQMFKGENWNFSYGIAVDSLENTILQSDSGST